MSGSTGFTPGGAKSTCAWPDPKPMYPPPKLPFFEPEHARIERARGFEVG